MRQHKLLDKNIILGYILVNVLYIGIIYTSVLSIASVPFSAILNWNENSANLMGLIVAGIAVFLIWRWWFKDEFRGFFGSHTDECNFGKSFVTGIKNGWVMFLYYAFTMVLTLSFGQITAPTVSMLVLALSAGIGEEIMFRSVAVAYLMRMIKTNRGVVIMMVFTSVVFGLAHFSNMVAGAGLAITVLQVIGAGCMGMVLCYAFLKSGNIMATMLLHGMTDFVCFLDASQTSDAVMIVTKPTIANYIDLAATIALLIWVIVRLKKPGELDSIREFWAGKWNR